MASISDLTDHIMMKEGKVRLQMNLDQSWSLARDILAGKASFKTSQ